MYKYEILSLSKKLNVNYVSFLRHLHPNIHNLLALEVLKAFKNVRGIHCVEWFEKVFQKHSSLSLFYNHISNAKMFLSVLKMRVKWLVFQITYDKSVNLLRHQNISLKRHRMVWLVTEGQLNFIHRTLQVLI